MEVVIYLVQKLITHIKIINIITHTMKQPWALMFLPFVGWNQNCLDHLGMPFATPITEL